ncbi:hypothetical protein ACQWU4_07345 [Chryseobacterium sp. MIQD13]|uniref:hypothetical protein n=1 Tax=Chryseobacterium sp. MIQD13 TaxID=3422310 RepID=UPI003D2A0345
MWILRIFILSFFIGFLANGQIPKFEHNYSKNDSLYNKDLIDFSKKFDFVVSHHRIGYWLGNKNYYKIITLNKNGWQVWESYYKKGKIKFNKIKKQPAQEKYHDLIAYFTANNIWEIDNTELNTYNKPRYLITEDGDTLFNKRKIVADASTDNLNFISKNKAKILGLYSSDINSESSNRFEKCDIFFQKWWDSVIK